MSQTIMQKLTNRVTKSHCLRIMALTIPLMVFIDKPWLSMVRWIHRQTTMPSPHQTLTN